MTLLHQMLDRATRRLPEKVAVITDGDFLTYGQLARQSMKLATFLFNAGVRRGDRVAIILPSSTHLVTAIFAVSRLGAMFVIQSQQAKEYHLTHVLADAEPTVVITNEKLLMRQSLHSVGHVFTVERDWETMVSEDGEVDYDDPISNDPVSLIYTSGSTSMPKAVISTHGNMCFATQAILKVLNYRETDTIGNFLPLSFDYGLYQLFLGISAGATVGLGSERDIRPDLLVKLEHLGITVLPLMPNTASILVKLLERTEANLPYLRMITNTGGVLPRAHIEILTKLLPKCSVYIMFGLTECKRVAILTPCNYRRKPNSVGKPLEDTECIIVDAHGRPCSFGEVGELVVRGPHVTSGYWQSRKLTEQRFRLWGPGLERALFTGDMCSMDSDGFLYFHGRNDDIYKQRGFRVSAVEVEAAALNIPGVSEAAVLLPGNGRGSVLLVVSEVSQGRVRRELQLRLEDSKLPDEILSIDSMPLSINGKIDKGALKDQLSGGNSNSERI